MYEVFTANPIDWVVGPIVNFIDTFEENPLNHAGIEHSISVIVFGAFLSFVILYVLDFFDSWTTDKLHGQKTTLAAVCMFLSIVVLLFMDSDAMSPVASAMVVTTSVALIISSYTLKRLVQRTYKRTHHITMLVQREVFDLLMVLTAYAPAHVIMQADLSPGTTAAFYNVTVLLQFLIMFWPLSLVMWITIHFLRERSRKADEEAYMGGLQVSND